MSYKMSMKGLSAAVAIAAATIGAASNAATITVNQVVAGAFDLGFNPIPVPDLNLYTAGVPLILQVDYTVSVTNLQPGERGFGNVGFNIAAGPGVVEAGAGGWAPNIATTDSNGAIPGGTVPLFSTNADAGPSPSDLQGIFATIAGGISNPNASDQRVKIGQAGGPDLLGTVFFAWDGVTTTSVSVVGAAASGYTLSGQFVGGVAGPSRSAESDHHSGTGHPGPGRIGWHRFAV